MKDCDSWPYKNMDAFLYFLSRDDLDSFSGGV